MGENSSIQWCDHTFNPWIGCTKVSPGCTHCYAETLRKRWGKDEWGVGTPRTHTSVANWKKPIAWAKAAATAGVRRKVFCASMADVFDEEVPDEWRFELFELIRKCTYEASLIDNDGGLDWLLVTKRPEKAASFLNRLWWESGREHPNGLWLLTDHPWPQPNFWLRDVLWVGVSVEDQRRAEERIPVLVQIPAKVRFLSMEPLLEAVDLLYAAFDGGESFGRMAGIHWVIVGGESGPKARPFNVAWALDIVSQCKAAGVPVFVKQMGANVRDRNDVGFDTFSEATLNESTGEWEHDSRAWPEPLDVVHDPDGVRTNYQGAEVRVRLRDGHGGDPAEWPERLCVRQFPVVGGGK